MMLAYMARCFATTMGLWVSFFLDIELKCSRAVCLAYRPMALLPVFSASYMNRLSISKESSWISSFLC